MRRLYRSIVPLALVLGAALTAAPVLAAPAATAALPAKATPLTVTSGDEFTKPRTFQRL